MNRQAGARRRLADAVGPVRDVVARVARPALWAARSAQGYRYGQRLSAPAGQVQSPLPQPGPGRLEQYFDANTEGPGIWKFRHYFEIYERHFSKFVGSDVHVVEIGIYSGGSLRMWTEYFGADSHVYGVDIQEACRAYEGGPVKVFIGDQGDPAFWSDFRREVPLVDIVIDDGGHQVDQQIATLEAVLPHIRPGGVYMCEDVGGIHNRFQAYVNGLSRNLASQFDATPFNQVVHSVHHYPFAVVIEKPPAPIARFVDERHGTKWEPFLG